MQFNIQGEWYLLDGIINEKYRHREILSNIAELTASNVFRIIIIQNNKKAYEFRPFEIDSFMNWMIINIFKIIQGGLFYFYDDQAAFLIYSNSNLIKLYHTEELPNAIDYPIDGIKINDYEEICKKLRIFSRYELPLHEWINGFYRISYDYINFLIAIKDLVYGYQPNFEFEPYSKIIEDLYSFISLLKINENHIKKWLGDFKNTKII